MKLTIEITMDDAAFFDEDGKPEQGTEVARILGRFTCGLKGTPMEEDTGKFFDLNGNAVGTWKVEA